MIAFVTKYKFGSIEVCCSAPVEKSRILSKDKIRLFYNAEAQKKYITLDFAVNNEMR